MKARAVNRSRPVSPAGAKGGCILVGEGVVGGGWSPPSPCWSTSGDGRVGPQPSQPLGFYCVKFFFFPRPTKSLRTKLEGGVFSAALVKHKLERRPAALRSLTPRASIGGAGPCFTEGGGPASLARIAIPLGVSWDMPSLNHFARKP